MSQLATLAEKLQNLTPVSRDVHTILLKWQVDTIVAEERRLGPSLQNPQHGEHIFQPIPGGWRFGTRVPYSRAHAKHRRERGMGDHMTPPKEVLEQIGVVIGRYLAGG
jgi:hypothetical protein